MIMFRVSNSSLLGPTGATAVVQDTAGNRAKITPVLVLGTLLGNIQITVEEGGVQTAKKVKALADKVIEEVDSESFDVSDEEMGLLKGCFAKCSGSFAAYYEAQVLDILDGAKKFDIEAKETVTPKG